MIYEKLSTIMLHLVRQKNSRFSWYSLSDIPSLDILSCDQTNWFLVKTFYSLSILEIILVIIHVRIVSYNL